jgi:osmotically inducible lipoprotein OsmE
MAASWAMTPRRGIAIAIAAVVLAGVVIGGVWFARAVFDPQWRLTLRDVMSSESTVNNTTTDVANITESVCSADLPCVEAYDTAEATYFRFGSRDEATQHAATVEDGFQSNYIVMDFAGKDGVSKTQQLWAMQRLAGMWHDYEGGYPNR